MSGMYPQTGGIERLTGYQIKLSAKHIMFVIYHGHTFKKKELITSFLLSGIYADMCICKEK